MNSLVARSIFPFLIVVAPVAVYTINPFEVTSNNIRPRLFAHDAYRIPSKSMLPTLRPGDYILISNTAYLETLPERGDVIVFNLKSTVTPKKSFPYIKRVLAMPGERIKIERNTVFINNQPLQENYIDPNNNKTPFSQKMTEKIVPSEKLFVLGDNRDNSSDSRIFGFISTKNIIGKATTILYGKNGRSGNNIQ
jgi:signal peptidase I